MKGATAATEAAPPGSPYQSPQQQRKRPAKDAAEQDAAATDQPQQRKHHQRPGQEQQGQPQAATPKEGAGTPQRQQGQGGPPSKLETMRKRLGDEEHSAISQILNMQQEQFKQQVEELHTISQRQWKHVSGTLFPYLESFRPALSSPAATIPLFANLPNPQQQQQQQNQAEGPSGTGSGSGAASAVNWWHDPMKVMGLQQMPALVGSMQPVLQQTSSLMESTMIGSHHPSLFAGQPPQQSAGHGGTGSEMHSQRQMPLASSSGRNPAAAESGAQAVSGVKRQHWGGGATTESLGGGQHLSAASKRQKEGHQHQEQQQQQQQQRGHHQHHQHQALASKGYRDSLESSQAKGPVSCPKPKVATPQSAIDILLALSEATSAEGSRKASQASKGQQSQTGAAAGTNASLAQAAKPQPEQ